MQTFTIPHTDIQATKLGFGAWAIAGGFNWGDQDDTDSILAIREAFDQGITFFDTAEAYGAGKSEALIAKVLKGHRHEIVLATKVLPKRFTYELLKEACHERLEILETDYIDLMQLHWPNHEVPIAESLQALEELRQEGKIRAFGVSNFGKQDLTDALAANPHISTNQVPYNLLWRAIEYEILPLCEENRIPILPYMPIMQGMLAGKYSHADEVPVDRARTRHFSSERPMSRHTEPGCEKETFETIDRIRVIADEAGIHMANLSIAWLLQKDAMGSVLVGARNADQVRRNMKAAETVLTDDVLGALEEATRPLKELLGSNADIWQSNSRYR